MKVKMISSGEVREVNVSYGTRLIEQGIAILHRLPPNSSRASHGGGATSPGWNPKDSPGAAGTFDEGKSLRCVKARATAPHKAKNAAAEEAAKEA